MTDYVDLNPVARRWRELRVYVTILRNLYRLGFRGRDLLIRAGQSLQMHRDFAMTWRADGTRVQR